MTYEERKILLIRKRKTVSGLARSFAKSKRGRTCRREEMSQCIRGVRVYPELREYLAKELDQTIEQLFGAEKAQAA
jgi:hypothetical protein